ncbi:MAG: hypothetical protein ACTHNU_00465, partial [Gaiellales bacterium]
MNMDDGLRVGVGDPSEISRVGIARSLAPLGIEVVAEAAGLAEAVRMVSCGKLDVVLIDMELPPVPGGVADAIAAAFRRGIPAIATGVGGS